MADLPLAHVAVVLVEPSEPGNVGAVCRAMWNLGATTLRLVVADEARRAAIVGPDARARACHGTPVLDSVACFGDLRSALRGRGRAFAFSARVGRFRQPRSELLEAAPRVAADVAGAPAFVFGREDSGLSAEELAEAHELLTIPVPGRDPVMNLSHAVTVALWEVARATSLPPTPQWRPAARAAKAEDRAALREEFGETVARIGLQPGAHGDLHRRIVKRFVDLFDRAGGEHADFSLLSGLLVTFRRALAKQEAGAALRETAERLPPEPDAPEQGAR